MSVIDTETVIERSGNHLEHLANLMLQHFGHEVGEGMVFGSAPGRMEISGNHVDHQGGRVIAAAIDRRTYGLAVENGTNIVRLYMDGFGFTEIDLSEKRWREPNEDEYVTSRAIVRGMLAAYDNAEGTVKGFDMVTTSDVPSGCGLSSSAAFEMLIGATAEALFGGFSKKPDTTSAEMKEVDAVAESTADGTVVERAVEIDEDAIYPVDSVATAMNAVRVENDYFGKPCGALDQTASALGGAVSMDFSKPEPVFAPLPFDPCAHGYGIVLMDSHCDHVLYSDEYAQVPIDMAEVAKYFGCFRLCEVDEGKFFDAFSDLREQLGDRRVLRALHYYDEVRRVDELKEALNNDDFELFLRLIRQSGNSSAEFLQNVSPKADGTGDYQPCMTLLALCTHLLDEKGAWRIHGGGFGGSCLAFVPLDQIESFCETINTLMGWEVCIVVTVDPMGAWAKRI